MSRLLRLLLLAAGLALAGSVTAATLVADAQTLGVNAGATARLPAAREFVVTVAGQARLRLRDVGTPSGGSPGFTKLQAVVTRGGTKIASMAAAGTVQFDTTPGTYKVQVVGTANQPDGAFDVDVSTVTGNTPLLQFADVIDAAPVPANPAESNLDVKFTIANPGTYRITLADRAFPAALSLLELILLPPSGPPVMLSGPCSTSACTSADFAVAPGEYELVILTTAADPDKAGLYSIAITDVSTGSVAYGATLPVGTLPAPISLVLPSGGGFTLALADFAIPAALQTLRATATQGAASLGSVSGTGSAALSGGVAGDASLFVFRKAATGAAGGKGSFGVAILQGGTAVFRDARPVPEDFDATNNAGSRRFNFNVANAGEFRVQLRELAFPSSFGSLRAVVVQNGSVVQVLTPGTAVNVPLVAGPAFLLVLGSPQSAGGNALFGLSVASAAGGAAILDQAQGIGPLIATRTFEMPASGSHDLVVDDLLFPDGFAELAVAVTEGSNLVGQIFGGGKITFNAAAGTHSISLLARPAAAAEYATWGFDVSTSPPVPTLTLAADPASVQSGKTAVLTWNSVNASNCTASGGWTGNKALSGTETTAALTVATDFTLICVGAGGNVVKTLQVTIGAPQKAGGGGRLDLLLLVATAALLYRCVRTRRRALQ